MTDLVDDENDDVSWKTGNKRMALLSIMDSRVSNGHQFVPLQGSSSGVSVGGLVVIILMSQVGLLLLLMLLSFCEKK